MEMQYHKETRTNPPEVLSYLRSGVKRPISVHAERPYSIVVAFNDGVTKRYNMQPELYGGMSFLKDYSAFEKVYIDDTDSIAWDDPQGNHIDTSADTVYIYEECI